MKQHELRQLILEAMVEINYKTKFVYKVDRFTVNKDRGLFVIRSRDFDVSLNIDTINKYIEFDRKPVVVNMSSLLFEYFVTKLDYKSIHLEIDKIFGIQGMNRDENLSRFVFNSSLSDSDNTSSYPKSNNPMMFINFNAEGMYSTAYIGRCYLIDKVFHMNAFTIQIAIADEILRPQIIELFKRLELAGFVADERDAQGFRLVDWMIWEAI